ncbi:hypothetical protein [Agarivorans sp. 1_MG-2023]|uniref:hypothetical protein n=1 Tax=Agarivorans sp. 1_MG-2023 TaxID=3062634 RepID=UPI0026E47ACE|nr:hypothetical protein [Agarivorans sp. 1_MG-2023]MDO6765242.1 hypothetical protein [Agarivorans sp. 1_MG-2023]
MMMNSLNSTPPPWRALALASLACLILVLSIIAHRAWLQDPRSVAPTSPLSTQTAERFLGKWQGHWGGTVVFTIDFQEQVSSSQVKAVLQYIANPSLNISGDPIAIKANFSQQEISYSIEEAGVFTRFWFEGEHLWAELSGRYQARSRLRPIN